MSALAVQPKKLIGHVPEVSALWELGQFVDR
jgi:hypothetical protein